MPELRRRMRPLLGTYVEIGVPEDFPEADQIIDQAFATILEVQVALNRHDPQSELSRLNREGHCQSMSALGRSVLRFSRWMMRASDGLFDCTMGISQVGRPEDIEIHRQEVWLRRGVKVTLDGIAKGFAVDRAIKVLRRAGVSRAYINAGGDLRVFGDLALPVWRRELDGTYQIQGHLKNAALASSQVASDACLSESFQGRVDHRGSHLAQEGVWSVLAPSAWLADALTKVACLASPSERAHRISSLGGAFLERGDTP